MFTMWHVYKWLLINKGFCETNVSSYVLSTFKWAFKLSGDLFALHQQDLSSLLPLFS